MTGADEPRGGLDLPGTPIFDGQSSRRGLRMNKMFMSFRDEAARMGLEITQRTGEQLQALIEAAARTPPDIIAKAAQFAQSGAN